MAPPGRAIFVGDFVDRGPAQLRSIDTVRRMVDAGVARAAMGNHRRWLLGFLADSCGFWRHPLAGWIQEELDKARQQYAGDNARWVDSDTQPGLPFLFNRLVTA